MSTATERIPILVTSQEKERIVKRASEAGLSTGEFLRRAAASFSPDDDAEMLLGMIDQMIKTTAKASAAIDDAMQFVDASNKRMALLEDSLGEQ